jgi:transposase-like protein
MIDPNVRLAAAVMSVIRRDDSVRGVADRFGVAESVVREWIDVFVVGGAMALSGLAAAGAPSYSPDPDLLMRRQAPLGRPRQKRAQRAPKKFLRSKSPK